MNPFLIIFLAPRTEPDVYSYPNGPLPPSYTLTISSARTRQRGYLSSTFAENFLKRNHSQETQNYIVEHRLAEIIEPILIELIINGAEGGIPAKQFLLEKLKEIREKGLDAVKWNHFIPQFRPDAKFMATKTRDEIERIDSYGPSEERFYVAAYNFRYKRLKADLLKVWQLYVEQRKERRRIKAIQNKMAKEHFEKSIRKYYRSGVSINSSKIV